MQQRILLGKDRVVFYEAVQEFRVAEIADGEIVGCGALHVMWEDLGEVRTLAVAPEWLAPRRRPRPARAARGRRPRARPLPPVLPHLRDRRSSSATASRTSARSIVAPDVYAELVRSPDEGVAEFLDLARVKPNTLGNTRMLKLLR